MTKIPKPALFEHFGGIPLLNHHHLGEFPTANLVAKKFARCPATWECIQTAKSLSRRGFDIFNQRNPPLKTKKQEIEVPWQFFVVPLLG